MGHFIAIVRESSWLGAIPLVVGIVLALVYGAMSPGTGTARHYARWVLSGLVLASALAFGVVLVKA